MSSIYALVSSLRPPNNPSMAALTYNGQRRYSRFDTPTSAWESNLDAKKNGMVADRKFHANSHDSPSTNGKTSIWNKKVDHRSPDTQYLDHMRRVSPQRRRSGPLSTNEQSLSPAASSRLATRRESNYRKTSIQSYQSLLQERDQLNKRAGDLDIKTHVLEHATHRESGGTEEQDKLATTTKLAHEHQVNQLKTEIKSAMDIAGAALEEAEKKNAELLNERGWFAKQSKDAVSTISSLQAALAMAKTDCKTMQEKCQQQMTQSQRDAEQIKMLMEEIARMKAREALPSPPPTTANAAPSVNTTHSAILRLTSSSPSSPTSPSSPSTPATLSSPSPLHDNTDNTDNTTISSTVVHDISGNIRASIEDATNRRTVSDNLIESAVNAARVRTGMTPKSSQLKSKITADMERRMHLALCLVQAEKESDSRVAESDSGSTVSSQTSSGSAREELDMVKHGSFVNAKQPSPRTQKSEDYNRVRNRMRSQMKADSPRTGRGPRIRGTEGKALGNASRRFNDCDKLNGIHGSRKILPGHDSSVVFG